MSNGPLAPIKALLALGRGPGLEASAPTPAVPGSVIQAPQPSNRAAPVPPQPVGGYVPPGNGGAGESAVPAGSAPGIAAPPGGVQPNAIQPVATLAPVDASGPVDFTIVLEVGSGTGY